MLTHRFSRRPNPIFSPFRKHSQENGHETDFQGIYRRQFSRHGHHHASIDHREALAILNEPCADNTDTYALVSNVAHDKLYLIMDFNPLYVDVGVDERLIIETLFAAGFRTAGGSSPDSSTIPISSMKRDF
jgi:hypothetical protein